MGEGLKHMFYEVTLLRAEDYDELGSLSEESDRDEDDEDIHDTQVGEDASQLPINRGLSKHYKGKSQSFSSFTEVRCVQDLAKKETPYKRKTTMKPSRSYAGGLDEQTCGPPPPPAAARPPSNKTGLPKKALNPTRGNLACSSSMARTAGGGGSFFSGGKPPHIPMQKNI